MRTNLLSTHSDYKTGSLHFSLWFCTDIMATDGSGLKALLGTTVIDKSGSEYPLTALSTPDTVRISAQ